MNAEQPSITLDPNVSAGKPIIRGTRISVEFVIGLMADGWSEADILVVRSQRLAPKRWVNRPTKSKASG
jgi:hypothetical protein